MIIKNEIYSQGGEFVVEDLGNEIHFTLKEGEATDVSCALTLNWEGDWNKAGYLLMPGAVYNGNRYECLPMQYPPFVPEGDLRRADGPVYISDVPRLPEIYQRSGDLSTPSVCYFDPAVKKAWILLGIHKTEYGYTGFEVRESADGKSCKISYTAPSVRPLEYRMCNPRVPSNDKGATLKAGEKIVLPYRIEEFDCENVLEMLDKFLSLRKVMGEDASLREKPDYNALMDTYIKKYDLLNWKKEEEYYRSGCADNLYQDWQSGWTGGGMFTLALWRAGDESVRERVIKSLDCYFTRFQDEKGYFAPVYYNGKIYGDDFAHPEKTEILMSRKQADMLYFLLLQYKEFGADLGKTLWAEGLRKGLDAVVRIWEKHGQFGQFWDTEKEEILIGSTASAGLMPAALMMGYDVFGDEKYKAVALASGKYYCENFTNIALSNAGPGEILQCSDSESAYALVESYVVLYRFTKDSYWLEAAKNATNLFATWVVSYNFEFPETSEFYRLGIKSVGSVIANCQNKHSAPGICSMSGDTLLELYKYTGDERYYDLIRDIAWNIPQYTSTEEVPIYSPEGTKLPAGYSCERVNMSDWEGYDWIGSVWAGSCCWCETAAMLTATSVLKEEFGK